MSVDFALFVSAFTTLIVIVDPPGNLPIFIALTSRMTLKERRRTAIQANLVALGILLTFGFFGFKLLEVLHITVEALQLSGGLLLLLVALQLLTGAESDPGDKSTPNVAIVPLGMPLLAGPGTIVAMMLSMERAWGSAVDMVTVVVALLLVIFVTWLTMRFANPIVRVLGNGGITLLTRLSGMLLAAIATQLMINAVLSIMSQM